MNKKALTLMVKEIMEVILAAAAIFILFTLMFKLIAPPIDKDTQISQAYLDSLKQAVGVADKGSIGELDMWQPGSNPLYLVIFGNRKSVPYKISPGPLNSPDVVSYDPQGNKIVAKPDINQNSVCICIFKNQELSCNNCLSLSLGVSFLSFRESGVLETSAPAILAGVGNKYSIMRENNQYYVYRQYDQSVFGLSDETIRSNLKKMGVAQ